MTTFKFWIGALCQGCLCSIAGWTKHCNGYPPKYAICSLSLHHGMCG